MNEPHQQTALMWVKTANAIAAAIRATGATNKIVLCTSRVLTMMSAGSYTAICCCWKASALAPTKLIRVSWRDLIWRILALLVF
jgi:hypothetical protein